MDNTMQDAADCPGKSAGRPKAADVEARMQELLQAAGELFLKNGYGKTSLEAIARAAHVAVRTIYVKFGGKAGLLNAVLADKRDHFFRSQPMETDPRPLRAVIDEFARQMVEMKNSPAAIEMQRVVMSEAPTNPELAQAFWNGGPGRTRDMLARYFARPEIRAQMRPDVPLDLLPSHLMACIVGDQFLCFMPQFRAQSPDEVHRDLERRLDLFYRSILPA
jgi:TetR/AcrR family transcriptional repressor of mexJK operon